MGTNGNRARWIRFEARSHSSTSDCLQSPGGFVPLRKDRRLVNDLPFVVPRIPGTIAFEDLLDRITDGGIELVGASKLMAMESRDETQAKPRGKILQMPSAGAAGARRRGAPLPRRNP